MPACYHFTMKGMQRFLFIAILALASVAFAADKVAVDKLIDKAKDFDGKPVEVTGKVLDYTEKTSKKGNPYVTFKLKGTKQIANVYLQGRLQKPPKNGDSVIVTGTFKKEKKVGGATYTNEIDASAPKGKPDNVKPAKAK